MTQITVELTHNYYGQYGFKLKSDDEYYFEYETPMTHEREKAIANAIALVRQLLRDKNALDQRSDS